MRTWITIAILLSAALAGCAGEEGATPTTGPVQGADDGTNETATSTTTSTEGPEGNETDAAPSNTPPTAELTADVVNGTAPLNVTFTVAGEDADGDDLAWVLTYEASQGNATGNVTQIANGTELPADAVVAFEEAGAYNVTLTVSDGETSGTASVMVDVEGEALSAASQHVEKEWIVGTPAVGCFELADYEEDADGVLYASFDVDPATIGVPFSVVITTDTEGDSAGFAFLDADREPIYSEFGWEQSSNVPPGAVTGVFWVCAGGSMHGVYDSGF